jgi:hypothetical protein
MLKVYKYPVRAQSEFEIEMDMHGKILKAENQHGAVCLWALVNPESKQIINRRFILAGTGHDIDYGMDKLDFISTFQVDGGRFIFHVFEIKK